MTHKQTSSEDQVAKYYLYHTQLSNNISSSRKGKGKEQHKEGARLAREAIADATGLDFATLTIAHTQEGKPFCPQAENAISISHSKGEVVVLVGPKDASLGIDVQHVDELRPYKELASRFIDPKRASWIIEKDTPLRFCYVWSRMEAMMKGSGTNLLTLLSRGEEEKSPLSSFSYETEEGLFLLSIYGCHFTPLFAHPLFA